MAALGLAPTRDEPRLTAIGHARIVTSLESHLLRGRFITLVGRSKTTVSLRRPRRVPRAAATGRSDAGDRSHCPGGTASLPLEPVAGPRAETAGSCRRARHIGCLRPDHCRAAFGHADEADRRFPPGLSDCDVRVRFDHRDPPVRPVFDSAFACHPRDRECISIHRAYPDPVCPDVSRRVCGHPPNRRSAERGVGVRSVALRVSSACHQLCHFEGWEFQQTVFEEHAACGDRPECRC